MLSAFADKVTWNVPFLSAKPQGNLPKIVPGPRTLMQEFLLPPGLPREIVRVGIE